MTGSAENGHLPNRVLSLWQAAQRAAQAGGGERVNVNWSRRPSED